MTLSNKLLCGFLFILAISLPIAIFVDHNSCHDTKLSVLPGPGDEDVLVVLELCYSDATNIILRNKITHNKEIVFSYGGGDDKVFLKWIDKNHLDVTIPDMSAINFEAIKSGSVHITYHFDKIEYP